MSFGDINEDKQTAYLGVGWEDSYRGAQAVRVGNIVHVSGQFSRDDQGIIIAPALVDTAGKIADACNREAAMRATCTNAGKVFRQFGATLDHLVEEQSTLPTSMRPVWPQVLSEKSAWAPRSRNARVIWSASRCSHLPSKSSQSASLPS